jgi:hypothetical protein
MKDRRDRIAWVLRAFCTVSGPERYLSVSVYSFHVSHPVDIANFVCACATEYRLPMRPRAMTAVGRAGLEQ